MLTMGFIRDFVQFLCQILSILIYLFLFYSSLGLRTKTYSLFFPELAQTLRNFNISNSYLGFR